MAYTINLGAWGSVFAVPSCVVDEHIRIASEKQLKVLLFLLKNNNTQLTDSQIADMLKMHVDDIKDSVDFWVQRDVLALKGDIASPAESAQSFETVLSSSTDNLLQDKPSLQESKQSRAILRRALPEPAHVLKVIGSTPELRVLLDEAQRILGKTISNSDSASLVMLYDTDGLPVDVILMLMQFCVDVNRGTIPYIQKTGIKWAEDGIKTVELAEEKIRTSSLNYSSFNRVASIFGLANVGSPTKKQLEFAGTWVGTWAFSDEMLRLAYERCVDTTGKLNMNYINGILKRWYSLGWKNPDEVDAQIDSTPIKKTAKKSSKKQQVSLESDPSYDLDSYEKKSIFD